MKMITGNNGNFNLLILFYLTLIMSFSFSMCDYCSHETCRRCCQVTPTGCMNAMDFNIRGRFISTLTFCQDCDCDDPTFGCGWKANNYGRVECTSCDYLRSMNNVKVNAFAGCGYPTFNGDVYYTTLPNAMGP